MAVERTYIIPLRRGWVKAARYKRAKKAVNTLKEFLVRHMKSETVLLMPELNIELWKHGMKNPPSRVKVNVVKDDKGVVKAQLFGKPMAEEKKEEEKKGIVKKIAETVTGKKEEAKPEVKAEAKPETPKVEAKPAPATKPVPAKPAAEKKPAAPKPAKPKAAPKPAEKPAEKAA